MGRSARAARAAAAAARVPSDERRDDVALLGLPARDGLAPVVERVRELYKGALDAPGRGLSGMVRVREAATTWRGVMAARARSLRTRAATVGKCTRMRLYARGHVARPSAMAQNVRLETLFRMV